MSTPDSTPAGSPFADHPLADALIGEGDGVVGEAADPAVGDAVDGAMLAGRDAAGDEAVARDDSQVDGPDDGRVDGPDDGRNLVDIPAVEVISRAAVLLMSAAAEQLGLADADPDQPTHRDLDQARTLITALAGLVKASAPDLGPHAAAFRDGLAGLQGAFREYSIHPDEPGRGPGE